MLYKFYKIRLHCLRGDTSLHFLNGAVHVISCDQELLKNTELFNGKTMFFSTVLIVKKYIFDSFYSGCYICFSTLFTVEKKISRLKSILQFHVFKRFEAWKMLNIFDAFLCENAEFFIRFFMWIVLNILDAFIHLNENKPFKALDI